LRAAVLLAYAGRTGVVRGATGGSQSEKKQKEKKNLSKSLGRSPARRWPRPRDRQGGGHVACVRGRRGLARLER
jgi:hypothetical protein